MGKFIMNLKIEIEKMEKDQKPLLMRLVELYNYDFSEYDEADISEWGYYGYDHIDDYWNEDERYPYLVKVNGKIAGFVLVCPYCVYLDDPGSHAIGEFFIMKKYRRTGVGQRVAQWIFEKHKGKWEVLYMQCNKPAQGFWTSVIEKYTKGENVMRGNDSDEMRGYTFEN